MLETLKIMLAEHQSVFARTMLDADRVQVSGRVQALTAAIAVIEANGGDDVMLKVITMEQVSCDCTSADTCPQGKTGSDNRCTIWRRIANA